MKIAVTNITPTKEEDLFQYLKDCGFDGVDFTMSRVFNKEFYFGDIDNVTDDMIKEHFTMLKQRADEAGITVCQTHGCFGGWLSKYNNDCDDVVKRLVASIKATHYLGCKRCVIHPIISGRRRYDLYKKENFDEAVALYRRLIPYLEEYDVYACIENMFSSDPTYKHICATILSRAEEMVEMCEVLGDRFKICLDVGHCLVTQDDPVEAVRICGDKLWALHTHDNSGFYDNHTFPFSVFGTYLGYKPVRCDWTEFMKALKEVNYNGYLSFEITPPGDSPEVITAGYKYLAKIGRYLTSIIDGKEE